MTGPISITIMYYSGWLRSKSNCCHQPPSLLPSLLLGEIAGALLHSNFSLSPSLYSLFIAIIALLLSPQKMQAAAFSISSPSKLPPLKLRRPAPLLPRFDPIHLSSSPKRTDLSASHNVRSRPALPRRPWSSFSSISPLSPWTLVPSTDSFEVKAAAAETSDEGEKGNALLKSVTLGLLFGLWYLFNIYFNIYNKQVLKAFHFPLTVTAVQFAVGSVLVLLMWTFNLYRPKVSGAQLAAILPLAVVHTLGNLFTNMSLGKVAVSFTHTIKAMEPFFSVLLSAMFLGETPTPWVVASLVPIVGGVALASVTEASFNWAGFISAMASNLTNQSRNVLSKKVMVKKEESLDNITLFSIITVMSFVLLAPVAIFMEGIKFTPAHLQSVGLNVEQLYVRSLLAALCFHAYQQVSYMILQRVSPVTHSVGNCVKRVVVIVSSVLVFKTPVTSINMLGTGIALAGVFLYSRVKRIKPKAKTA